MLKTLSTGLAIAFLCGCVAPVNQVDRFSGVKTEGFRNNQIPAGMMYVISVDPKRIATETGPPDYFVDVSFWSQNGWLFIQPGQSLIFLIDGERVPLDGDGSLNNREVSAGASVQEDARYNAPPDLFRRIGQAKSVELRLDGQSKHWDGKFSKRNQLVFLQFADKYCPPPQ